MDAHAQATAAWYRSPAGRRAASLLAAAIRPLLLRTRTTRLLAIGAAAVLDGFDLGSIDRLALVEPSGEPWPATGPSMALAATAERLPFAEAVFDTVLAIHALETSGSPRAMLRELWRVLAPAGEIVLVVPNRRGLWSLGEASPFGEGRPYGRGALRRALDEAMFEPVEWRMALAAPPVRALGWSEALLAACAPGLAGVHVVRAAKRDGLAPVGSSPVRGRAQPVAAAPQG